MADKYHPNSNPVPKQYNVDDLPPVFPDQVVWYDKIHFQQVGKNIHRTGIHIRFVREEDGKYMTGTMSHTNDIYANVENEHMFKFPNDDQLCLEINIKRNNSGRYIGIKTIDFEYTHKNMGIGKWKRLCEKRYCRI